MKACRLFLPYNGWLDIGFTPDSDGHGEVNLTLTIVITYKNGWIALNQRLLVNFIIALREVGGYNNLPNRRYFDELLNINERFDIKKIDDYFNILFIDGEGDVTAIKHFDEYDVLGMLNIECIIDSRIENLKLQENDTVVAIQALAHECIEDHSKILKLSENQYANNLTAEIAVNHFIFFQELINEKNVD